MLCRNCKKEIDKDSYICPYCSYQVQTLDGQFIEDKEKKKVFDLKLLLLLIALVLALISFLAYNIFANPEEKFLKYVMDNKYEKASTIYENKIRTNEKRKEYVVKELDKILDEMIESYNNEKIAYEDASKTLELIDRLSINKEKSEKSLELLGEYKKSKDAFLSAEKNIKDKFFIDALLNINEIIKDDINFESGQKLLIEIEKDVFSQLKEYVKTLEIDNDFESIKMLIQAVKTSFSSNNDLRILQSEYIEKENLFLEAELEVEKQNLIKEQKVLVQEAEMIVQKDYIDLYYVIAKVKNNIDKMLISYDIAILAFDKEGKPIKLSDEYLKIGRVDDIKLQKDEIYGEDAGWNIMEQGEENIVFIKACIIKAGFTDGEIWENAYYEHWLKQYNGKNLDL